MLALAASVLALGCGDDSAPPDTVSTGARNAPTEMDGGPADPAPARSLRPDGPPILPATDADYLIELGGPAAVHRVEVEADLGALDVHFSIDTSASIGGEINQLQEDLEDVVIAQLRNRVPDVSFGVSRFEDFPAAPFGASGDEFGTPADTPFELLAPLTSDVDVLSSAVASLDRPLGFGGDSAESGAEALYQIATGEGYVKAGNRIIEAFRPPRSPGAGGGVLGGVGFREGALHVVMHVTDAPSHDPNDYANRFPGTHSLPEAAEALGLIGARVVAIVSGQCAEDAPECKSNEEASRLARAQLEQVALATGAFEAAEGKTCPHGLDGAMVDAIDGRCPYVFDVSADGEGMSDTVVDSVLTLVNGVRFGRISAEVVDDPLGFVERVVPVVVEQVDDVPAPNLADALPDGMPDGELDSFVDVRARARVAFDVHLRNEHIAPSDADQRFRVTLRISGDQLTIARPALRIVIPAGEPPPIPTGGTIDPDEADSGSP